MQLLSPVIAATKQSRIPTIFILYHPILLFYGLKHTCSQLSLVTPARNTMRKLVKNMWI